MEDIKLIYFKGCPNVEKMQVLLCGLRIAFEEIRQEDLPPNHPYKLLSSPAILKKERLIFGERLKSPGGGCSIDLPTKRELDLKLNQ